MVFHELQLARLVEVPELLTSTERSSMRILLTGSTGFIGHAVMQHLISERPDDAVVVLVREHQAKVPSRVEQWLCPAVDDEAGWIDLPPARIDAVIHCAGHAHVPASASHEYRETMQRVNVGLTDRLITAALQRDSRRFILLSSIAVNGQASAPGRSIAVSDGATPCNAYGESKRDAEGLLQRRSEGTTMSYVCIRPPLVYGHNAPGNFRTLSSLLRRRLPLPLASVTHNRRSFVALDNLVDLLITCIDHPAAANQTFLVSDGEDLSTADLLRRLGQAMNKPARLFPVPPALLQFGATALGKRDMAQRLLGNLQVDISHTRETLNWTPPISVDEGLRRAVAGLVQ
jgi:nucleoside-diphosphate-sugar epimerase